MRFPRFKSSSNGSRKSSSAASLQNNGEKKVDGAGAAGTNTRQVAPETSVDYGSSINDTFFEACPWLDSDCDDDFYSVNGDLTPARSVASQQSGKTPPPGSPNPNKLPPLPTLGAILQAEPLNRPPSQQQRRKLGDLLRESQDGDDLSRADSFRAAQEAGRCCVPHLARAVSCNARARRSTTK